LKNILQSNSGNLSEAELTYFKRSLTDHFRLPNFYGLPKVHKNPIALRPAVSTTNSLLAVFSTWLDYKMHSGGMGLRLSKLTSGSGGRGRKLSGGFGGHICKVQCHRGVIWGHVYDSWSYKVVADELFSH